MSLGLLGTKVGMTREFLTNGQSVPVTVIRVEKGRVLDIIEPTPQTVEALMKLDLASGVDIEIKI